MYYFFVLFLSNPAQQQEHHQNDRHQAQPAAWVIAPILAMGPGGECADKHQDEQNE
jgi:hypothetical protein